MTEKIVKIFAVGMVFIMFFTVAFWDFWPYQVITFKAEKLLLVKKTLHRGDTIAWDGSHKNLTDGTLVKVSKQIICENIAINLPDASYVSKYGEFDLINASVIVPESAEGTCHVAVVSSFSVNPIRTIIISKRTENFVVTQ